MAKTYRINNGKIEKSEKTKLSGSIEKSVELIDKSVVQLGGTGEWKQFAGVKLFCDPSGVVIKGPDVLIGRKFDDIARLSFQDSFTVMRSVMRATGATNKAYEDEIDKVNKQKIIKDAEDFLNKAIERGRVEAKRRAERQNFI